MGTQVVGGRARGMPLAAPRGRDIRPTRGSVRSAIFSILASRGARTERVLDLYAGTGAMGIEALSRGALWADFVEKSRLHCRAIRGNLDRLGLSRQSRLFATTVEKALKSLPGDYDLIFLDPPYNDPALEHILSMVARPPMARPGAHVVVEHPPAVSLADSYSRGRKVDGRRYGDTCISIFLVGGE